MLKRLFATRKRPYVPGINRPETIRLDLSGNILTLQMPPHSYDGWGPSREPPQINIYESHQYTDDSYQPEWRREGISSFEFLHRKWSFYGPPWRTQSYGTISFNIFACRYDALPEGMSCFNPNHFEQITLRNLWYSGVLGGIQAPIHWRLRQESGATWLYFERHNDDLEPEPLQEILSTCLDCHLRIPVDDRYYLDLHFNYFGYVPAEYCLTNMNALRDAVLDSVQLELSSSAKERLAEAKRKWPDARASEHRDPEPWVFPKLRDGVEGEEDFVVLEPGRPPVLTP
ncbi:hypothetical protein [Microbulbifer thermotolerans]|uniref:hypothetical protein n=1 Tax=Microbulbifer thermotolerans TaxID=252514 RepID=UPI00224B7206|nr:hypothetical protein [Microbulbifer thermotolerans]MCX2779502.1 hypothetical protein [Microbulbifer thermotolerans]MCX2806053.1 hypothetical protein [Microbulbifer thermotolerans]